MAALDVLSEAGIIDDALRIPSHIAYTRWTRAQDLVAIGDTAHAFAELDTAATAAALATGVPGDRAVADVELARGRLLMKRDPERSRLSLERAVEAYRALGAVTVLPAALFQSAVLAKSAGEKERARSMLAEAISVIERRRAAFTSADAQAAYYETVENVFDVAIQIELDGGSKDAAFDLLERERVAIRPETHSPDAAPMTSFVAISGSIPHDMLFVTYAVLADRVAIWYAHEGTRVLSRVSSRSRYNRAPRTGCDAVRSEPREAVRLEHNCSRFCCDHSRPNYDELTSWPWCPDRELVAVPFAALWDSTTKRFVVEDHAILTEPSASFMVASARAARSLHRAMSALVVGNPAEVTSPDTALADLPGAAAEAQQVAALYTQRIVSDGASGKSSFGPRAAPSTIGLSLRWPRRLRRRSP